MDHCPLVQRTRAPNFSRTVFTGPEFEPARSALFNIIQRILNYWYNNPLTNGKSPPSKFCRHVINVQKQECSYVWMETYVQFFTIFQFVWTKSLSNVLQWRIRWDFKTNLSTMWYHSCVYKPRCLDKQGTWHKLATISIYSYILCHREVIMSEIWMLSKLNKGIWHLKKFNYFIHGLDSAAQGIE